MENEFLLFLGRFHPLVVHLPIGFLVLALVMQFMGRYEKYKALKFAQEFTVLLGAISAFLAILLGFSLASGGDYDNSTLGWHKWSGIALAVFAVLWWAVLAGKVDLAKMLKSPMLIKWHQPAIAGISALLLIIAGHNGGNLTHGNDYLTYYMPQPLRSLAGLPEREEGPKRPPVTNLAEAAVFEDLVQPILESRCKSCHNPKKRKGKLDLMTVAGIEKGGKGGAALVSGSSAESEIFKRITLPEDHDDVMPPEGKKQLTEDQVKILRWWMDSGGHLQGQLGQHQPSEEIMPLVLAQLGLNEAGEMPEKKVAVSSPASQQAISNLQAEGFKVIQISQESPALEVIWNMKDTTLTDAALNKLRAVKGQVMWLTLSQADFASQQLDVLKDLSLLTKLKLDRSSINDEGIKHLQGLEHLEYLNLYGTKVSEVAGVLETLPALRNVYLWQTQVKPESLTKLREEREDLDINIGLQASN